MPTPVLYITYDGLLDPLGGSQIVPYILGISAHSGPIHVLSFEKPARFLTGKAQLGAELEKRGIIWHPLLFSSNTGRLGVFRKVRDFLCMYIRALYIGWRYGVQIVHARSHVAGWVALFLKRILGTRFLFDCRGLWVDERVDKGGWDLQKVTHRLQYRYFKARERSLFHNADHIVVLTQAVVPEVIRLGASRREKITIIPCCADFEHFKPLGTMQKSTIRQSLGLPVDSTVLGYLGSVGKMYMVESYLKLFQLAATRNPDIYALFITPDREEASVLVDKLLPRTLSERIFIREATRDEVPGLLGVIDILVSFIQPSYARRASSPTKNAEALAMGIPLVCNPGVGDVEEEVAVLQAGYVVNPNTNEVLEGIVENLRAIKELGGIALRNRSRMIFGLERAHEQYKHVYANLTS